MRGNDSRGRVKLPFFLFYCWLDPLFQRREGNLSLRMIDPQYGKQVKKQRFVFPVKRDACPLASRQ